MRKIMERVVFSLYLLGVLVYFFRYDGLDAGGVAGILAAIQLELLGSADEKLTIVVATAVYLVPYFIGCLIVRKFATPRSTSGTLQPDWPENLVSTAIIVAIVATCAQFFLKAEITATSAGEIYGLNLNESEKLPDDTKFVNAVGKIQGDYLYVLERTRLSRTERATVYAPFTADRWMPGRAIAYIVALHYGYTTRPSPNGKGTVYSVDATGWNAAKPFEAVVSSRGVPVAVTQTLEREGKLKFANKLYLLEHTAFPGGKPMNEYEDFVPFLPWLLPAGLSASVILLLAGLVGFLRRRQSLA